MNPQIDTDIKIYFLFLYPGLIYFFNFQKTTKMRPHLFKTEFKTTSDKNIALIVVFFYFTKKKIQVKYLLPFHTR